MTAPSRVLAGAASAALLLALSACSSSSAPAGSADGNEKGIAATPTAQVTAQPAANAKLVPITIKGRTVSPVGASVVVSPKQPVVLEIQADAAGQLHVHSSPEQHVNFPAGASQITLSFDKKGLIAIEDHAANQLIVQIAVN